MMPLDIDDRMARTLLKDRPIDAHKGTMGHAALFAGSYGMAGAAILAGRACMRSGVGKLTVYAEERIYPILQSGMPEAVFKIHSGNSPSRSEDLPDFEAAAAGPGIGSGPGVLPLLSAVMTMSCPLVLDADALTLLSCHPVLMERLPEMTVLTPHRGEYDRLFGGESDPAEVSRKHGCILVMKGARSVVHTPEGRAFRNTTGNPGMATAGSGDVLTGIILGLLARGCTPVDAACLGVFLHGRSGDIAQDSMGVESLIASDLIDNLGAAYLSVHHHLK
jgi:NAD(P)H-hydrate epimerase